MGLTMDLINTIAEAIPAWLDAILLLLVGLNAIAALTPPPQDDNAISKALKVVRKIIDVFAFNVGNAKNKNDS